MWWLEERYAQVTIKLLWAPGHLVEIRWSNVCRYSGTMTNYTRCKEDWCASWCWGIHFLTIYETVKSQEQLHWENLYHLLCKLCILFICSWLTGHEKLGHAICHRMGFSINCIDCRSGMDGSMRAARTQTLWLCSVGSLGVQGLRAIEIMCTRVQLDGQPLPKLGVK